MTKTKIAILILAILVVGIIMTTITYYTTQLSMVMNGQEEMTVGLNSVYEDEGVKAIINGKDFSHRVKVKGKVDTAVPGTYTLTYKAGTLEMKRTVTVMDKMDPELNLTAADSDISMVLGDEFREPGYTAIDNNGNDISDRVRTTGCDFMKAGTHTLYYTVTDDKGSTTRVSRTVNISPNTKYKSPGLPICMYHYVYDENNPPADLHQKYGNYISAQALEEEINWLKSEDYYFPTWEEVRAFVDGEQLLPDKSIVLTFDDGAYSFLNNGIPVFEKCKVPATSFMITSIDGESKVANYQSKYVNFESHTHDMHKGGGTVGRGGYITGIPYDEGLEDLKKSIEICGSSDAMAYPYGDYDARAKKMVKEAGFLCAVTIEYGKAYPGDDPYSLPRVRMTLGQSLRQFQSMVSPK